MKALLVVLAIGILVSSLAIVPSAARPSGVPDGDWWAHDDACKVCGQERDASVAHVVCIEAYHSFKPREPGPEAAPALDWFVEAPLTAEPRSTDRIGTRAIHPSLHLSLDPPFKIPIA